MGMKLGTMPASLELTAMVGESWQPGTICQEDSLHQWAHSLVILPGPAGSGHAQLD